MRKENVFEENRIKIQQASNSSQLLQKIWKHDVNIFERKLPNKKQQ